MSERNRWSPPEIPEAIGFGRINALARHYKHAVRSTVHGDHDTLADIAEDTIDLKNYLKESLETGSLSQATEDVRTRIRNTMVKDAAEALGHLSGDQIPDAHYKTRLDSLANTAGKSTMKVKGLLGKIATKTAADELIHYAQEAVNHATQKQDKDKAQKELALFKKWKASADNKRFSELIWKTFDIYHGTAALGKGSLSNLMKELTDSDSKKYDGMEIGQIYQLIGATLQKGHQNIPGIFEAQVSSEFEKKYDEHEPERSELVGAFASRVEGYQFEENKKDWMTSLLSPTEMMRLLRQKDLKEKDVRAYGMIPTKDNEIKFSVPKLENTYMDKAA